MPLPYNVASGEALLNEAPNDNLISDSYATAESAPVATTQNADGVGIATYTQVDGNLSKAGGKLVFPAQATPVWGDLGFAYTLRNGGAVPRRLGRVYHFSVNITSGTPSIFSWHSSTSLGNAADSNIVASILLEGSTFRVSDGVSYLGSAGDWTLSAAGVEEQFAMVLRNTGCYIFRRDNGTWMLVWAGIVGTTANVYPVFKNYQGVGTIDLVRVRDLKKSPFMGEYELATVNVTTDTQSIGAELLTNGDFSTWSGDNPTSWTVAGEVGSDPAVTEVASGGGAGTGAAKLVSSATANAPTLTQSGVMSPTFIYEDESDLSAYTSGTFFARKDGNATDAAAIFTATSTGIRRAIYRYLDTGSGGLRIQHLGAAPANFTLNAYSHKRITLPTAQTASADATHILEYTLPVSPIAGQRINLIYRILSPGDEFLFSFIAYVQRNDANSAWDFRMDRVSSGTITNLINVTGIGSSDAIGVVANGGNHDCYTKSGTGWTKRGSTAGIPQSFPQATGLNYCYSTGFTFGRLHSYPIYDTRFRTLLELRNPQWLAFHDFTLSEAATIAARRSEFGGNLISYTQNDGTFSVYGNALVFPAQSTPADGDLGLYMESYARVAGRALIASFNVSTLAIYPGFAWNNSGAVPAAAFSSFFRLENPLAINDTSSVSLGHTITANVTYLLAMVLRATGCYYFIKGGIFTDWTLVWVQTTGTTTPVFPSATFYTGVGKLRWIGVKDLGGVFKSDYLACAFNITVDTQSIGSEQLTNGDFATWSGDNPTGWTVTGESGSDPDVNEVGSGQSHLGAGTGMANLYSSATTNTPSIQQGSFAAGSIVEAGVNVNTVTAGSVQIRTTGNDLSTIYTTTGVRRVVGRINTTASLMLRVSSTVPADVTIDDATLKVITLPTAQAVAADAVHDLEFALPASPVAGQEIHLVYRVAAAGEELLNCWDLYLRRNDANSAWDIRLDSISSGTRTNRSSTTGVGTPTAIRVEVFGNNHNVYTFASGAWTKRGSTITNSSFNTATGANYLYSAGFTFGAWRAWAMQSATQYSTELDPV